MITTLSGVCTRSAVVLLSDLYVSNTKYYVTSLHKTFNCQKTFLRSNTIYCCKTVKAVPDKWWGKKGESYVTTVRCSGLRRYRQKRLVAWNVEVPQPYQLQQALLDLATEHVAYWLEAAHIRLLWLGVSDRCVDRPNADMVAHHKPKVINWVWIIC